MNYATIKTHDVANGPGVRVSLYVSGCTHHCKNCFNPETWDFNYGEAFTEAEENQIISALAPSYIKGFTLLGGEPFEPQNQLVLAPFLEKVRAMYPEKSIWCFSGYRFDDDMQNGWLAELDTTAKMLSCIDILVDGEFVEEKKDISLRFKGSSNQRIIDVQSSLKENNIVRWSEDRTDE